MLSLDKSYDTKVISKELSDDLDQRKFIAKLSLLQAELKNYNPFWRRIFFLKPFVFLLNFISPSPKSLYVYGGVGVGKTMLVKLFFNSLMTSHKSYYNFNEFLILVNRKLSHESPAFSFLHRADPLRLVALDLLRDSWLFCFDECVIIDPADALIFGKIAKTIISNGGVIICTSNFRPENFSPRAVGLDAFLRYKDYFFQHATCYNMTGDYDYRMDGENQKWPYYFSPLTAKTKVAFRKIICEKTGVSNYSDLSPARHLIKTRSIAIELIKLKDDVYSISFKKLLDSALSTESFSAISIDCRILFLDDVLKISSQNTSIIKRFILLVDVFYNSKCLLIIRSEVPPYELYTSGLVSFEFNRTISRLSQMQRKAYGN